MNNEKPESTGVENSKNTVIKKLGTKTKKPKVKLQYPLIEIIWDDASGLRHGWMDKTDKLEPQLVCSVGFLIADTPDYVVYASDTDSDGSHNGRTQIPRGMIKYMKTLRKASK